MKKKVLIIQLITILSLSFNGVFAKPTAAFTTNVLSGCPPLLVQFTNQSTGTGTLNYLWNLGNGTSTLKDPQNSYESPGIYPISLIVTEQPGGESDTAYKLITVFENPQANFSVQQKACVPYTAHFTDLSQPGDSPIIHWTWDFRTGVPDTLQNPTHTYSAVGKYDVFLEVTDANGCKGSIDRPQYIDVVNPPDAQFSVTPSSACVIPANFQFTSTSTGSGILTYNWSFGDNTFSTSKNPLKTYNSFGTFAVKLKVNSDYGCSDSSTINVSINPVIAAGTLKQGGVLINNNDIICPGQVQFSSTSTGTNYQKWIFGDGQMSLSKNVTHDYTTPGLYTALLIASPDNSCADTLSWTFTVESIMADFSMSTEDTCLSPVNISFTDHSTNATSWEWTFNDGSKAYTKNVSHIYAVPPETDVYQINPAVVFQTILKATSPHGCTSSKSKYLTIKKPTSIFTIDTASGCKPLDVLFTDKSLSDQSITSWRWIFDDGTIVNGGNSIAHSYTTEGEYDARLVITNASNCSDTSYSIRVGVGKILKPDFTASNANPCPNETIQFINSTPESGSIQGWHYSVNGLSIASPTDIPSPYWKVVANPGLNDVQLQVDYNGCISDTVKEDFLLVKDPMSDFSFSFSCDDPYDYNFTNLSQGYSSYEWKFGDGQTSTTTLNPAHTYASEDNYLVELITHTGSCYDTASKVIKVREPKAAIISNSIPCAGMPVVFKGNTSYGMVDYCYEKYYWYFADTLQNLRTNNDSVSHTFPDRGNYTVKLFTRYDNGCIDSAIQNISIFQPHVDFDADTLYGCSPFEVNFTDLSYADTYPLVLWNWEFDDGTDSSYNVVTNPMNHLFVNPGEYQVELSVTDNIGCIGTHTETVSTANPDATFTVDSAACVGEEVLFNYSYTTGDSAIWNFGDGTIVSDTNNPASHTYQTRGDYTVELTIYKYACADTYTSDSGYIHVQLADASFHVSDSVSYCYPVEITFNYYPSETVNVDESGWIFGYDNNIYPYGEERKFNYPYPGEYHSKLIIETTNGCRDTSGTTITVNGPTGTFSMSPRAACIYDSITFKLNNDTNNVIGFEWHMGDFSPPMFGDPVKYLYKSMGTFIPKLFLFGDSGCIPPPVTDTLLIYEVVADSLFFPSAYCDQYDILFTNNSIGNSFNYWDFGNGTTSNEIEPIVKFSPGIYNIVLIVANDQNCSDTAQHEIEIYALPSITIGADTFSCAGQGVIINASGGDVITWLPADGLANPHAYTTLASPDNTTTYTAIVTDTATICSNSGSLEVFVQQPPSEINIILEPGDSVVLGEKINITADSLPNLIYSWSPVEGLSCTNCASPIARPLVSTAYTLEVSDSNNCFQDIYNVNITIKEIYSIELPTAFSPNCDCKNNIVYVRGGGIDKILEFRIYNRWGNEVFNISDVVYNTDDIAQGWDGTYKGKPQNMDSYAYTVKALMLNGSIVEKKGMINLLK